MYCIAHNSTLELIAQKTHPCKAAEIMGVSCETLVAAIFHHGEFNHGEYFCYYQATPQTGVI